MADSYSINEFNEVVPYTAGRASTDTNARRDATDLELEQRDEIARLESEAEVYREALQRIAELPEGWRGRRLVGGPIELDSCADELQQALPEGMRNT